ncbi:MAG: DUF87 domain-containing protein [Xanthomonadales bacterium]|nr:DUF87 domain-containing protein [Xanthomonadales bacterium]
MTNNTLVGHITEINGAEFLVELLTEKDGVSSVISFGDRQVHVGQVGSYMLVKQAGPDILVLVESMWLQGDGGSSRRMLRVNPLGSFTGKGEFHRGISHYPVTGAELHLVTDAQLKTVFSNFEAANFSIGSLSSFPDINVYMDPSAFFGRHAAILGQSGSGKSWMVASIMQSTLKSMPNAHIIMLDPHNEYSQGDSSGKPVFPLDNVHHISAADMEIPYWLLPFRDLVDLLIDSSEENASLQIAFLRSTVMELKVKANKDIEIGHIHIDTPVYFSMAELFEHFKLVNERTSNFGKASTPLTGKFDSLLIKLESRMNDTRYDFLLAPKKRASSLSLPGLLRDFVGMGENRAAITVIDLSSVPFDVQPTVSAQIARMAFEFNFWNPKCREFPLLLVCEEAHNYISSSQDSRYNAARLSFERIAKTGRKYGVGLCLVSQRPHDLSETVLSQCSSFFCMRITNPVDQDYIQSLVPEAAKGLLSSLSSLGQGEVIAIGEASPLPVRMQVNLPQPPPNAQTIDFYKMWAATDLEEVDVDVIVQHWWQNRH